MAYIGQRPTTGENNSFKVLDDITSYTLTFDGSSSTVVSAANDTISYNSHRFVDGQKVTYSNGGGINCWCKKAFLIIVEKFRWCSLICNTSRKIC